MGKLKTGSRWIFAALAVTTLIWLNGTPATVEAGLAADLSAEQAAMTAFHNDLSSLEKKLAELRKQSKITAAEMRTARASAEAVKAKSSQIQQACKSAVSKLKAAKEWDNFDTAFLARESDPKVKAVLQEFGGPKRMLESTAQLSGLNAEIDGMLSALNSKVAVNQSPALPSVGLNGFQVIRASFVPALTAEPLSPVAFKSAGCYARAVIYVLIGGSKRQEKMKCACNDNPSPAQLAFCDAL